METRDKVFNLRCASCDQPLEFDMANGIILAKMCRYCMEVLTNFLIRKITGDITEITQKELKNKEKGDTKNETI